MARRNKYGIPDEIDEDLKGLYEQMISSGEQGLSFIRERFDTPISRQKVKFRFVASQEHFNASACKTKNGYEVNIQVHTVELIRTLFDGVLAFDNVFPELNNTLADMSDPMEMRPFRKKMTADGCYEPIPVTSDRLKLLLSSILTELCCTFIVFHEIAHVVLGHAEHATRNYGTKSVFELYDMSDILEQQAHVMRASEIDADTLAAQLLAMFIVSFEQNFIDDDGDHGAIFRLLKADKNIPEHLTALAMAALSGVFIYMGHSENALQKESFHPYPILRVNKIRDKVIQKVNEQQGINTAMEYKAFADYGRQIILALVQMNLYPFPDHPGIRRNKMDGINAVLNNDADQYRHLYDPYAWIPSDTWGD